MTKVYKLLSLDEWRLAGTAGVFEGSAADRRDGFIHLSDASQAASTAKRYFIGQDDLLLLTLDARGLGAALRWEPSSGGALFPHLYGSLALDRVEAVRPLSLDPDGVPVIGDLEP